jgi:hypothetical protein
MKTPLPIDTSTPRKKFPKWSRDEQDLWTDLFASYSGILVQSVGEEYRPDDAEAEADYDKTIQLAAHITDTAMQELQYRFWIQKQPKRPTVVKKKRKVQRGRK